LHRSKDRKKLLAWETCSTLFVIFFGSAMHFIYGWSGQFSFIGLFAPVNESVWEHLKLGYWSLALFAVPEYAFLGKKSVGFVLAKLAGVLVLEITIVSIYYAYAAVAGRDLLIVDIGSYVVGAILCQLVTMRLIGRGKHSKASNALGGLGIAVLAALFMLFTYRTPRLEIFRDGNTNGYGATWRDVGRK
jgi:hypothetical protein